MNPLIKTALFAALATSGPINPYPTIGSIPLPQGYRRLTAGPDSFASWLRNISLKQDLTVYLYNGTPKRNQNAQFAVLDISVGRQDLQQCADAVMRLRAEFLFAAHEFSSIRFYTDQGVCLNFPKCAGSRSAQRASFDSYLNKVFEYCGTHSLEKQLSPSKPITAVEPGDVLIKGGWPGHAMLVVDVAKDGKGHRIFLLAQSYMPAQDIHVVLNPADPGLSPWFPADPARSTIQTPEWTFTINQLRTWPPCDQK